MLLSYDRDIRGKSVKAGLTDLDVLGIRLDPGFRFHTAVADCKTVSGQVPERLFWLSGVGKFFGSDTNLLVRSQPLPDHSLPLARSLDIAVAGPDDLTILTNTYVNPSGTTLPKIWRDFFSPQILGETLSRLSRLPAGLSFVERYREAGYWMDEPYRQLQQIITALQYMAKDGSGGPTYQLVFADFVWLYVVALWRACEALYANGLSRLEQRFELYVSGNEAGWRDLQRLKKTLESLARQANLEVSLPITPPYFKDLKEVVVRCVRRPKSVGQLARRAEWLVIGQIVGNLGAPPWSYNDDDLIGDKLLGDIAQFMVRASGLKPAFLEFYLGLLQQPAPPQKDLPLANNDQEGTVTEMQDNLHVAKGDNQRPISAEPESTKPTDAPINDGTLLRLSVFS